MSTRAIQKSGSEAQTENEVIYARREGALVPVGQLVDDTIQIHDTDEEYVRVECRDCGWSNTNPALQARDFADAHEERHGHEVA